MPQLKGWNSVVPSHGRIYLLEGFDNSLTAPNASLAGSINWQIARLAILGYSNLALSSLMLWAALSLTLIPTSIRTLGLNSRPDYELTFWLIGFSIVLLSAPLTWSMAVIWLLPVAFLIPLVISNLQSGEGRAL